ncbi:hypothetical protein QTN25_000314 [Entamoeba marina]
MEENNKQQTLQENVTGDEKINDETVVDDSNKNNLKLKLNSLLQNANNPLGGYQMIKKAKEKQREDISAITDIDEEQMVQAIKGEITKTEIKLGQQLSRKSVSKPKNRRKPSKRLMKEHNKEVDATSAIESKDTETNETINEIKEEPKSDDSINNVNENVESIEQKDLINIEKDVPHDTENNEEQINEEQTTEQQIEKEDINQQDISTDIPIEQTLNNEQEQEKETMSNDNNEEGEMTDDNKEEIDKINKAIEELKRINEEKEQQIEQLKKEKEQQIINKQKEEEELKQTNKELLSFIQHLSDVFTQKELEVDSLINDVDAINLKTKTTISKQNDFLHSVQSTLQEQNEQNDSILDSLSNTSDYLIKQTTIFTEELKNANEDKMVVVNRNNQLKNDIQTTKSQIEDVQNKYSKLEQKLDEDNQKKLMYVEQIKNSKQRITDLSQQIQVAKHSLELKDSYDKQLTKFEMEKASFEGQITLLQSQIEQAEIVVVEDDKSFDQFKQEQKLVDQTTWKFIESEKDQMVLLATLVLSYKMTHVGEYHQSVQELYTEIIEQQIPVMDWKNYVENSLESNE